MKVIINNSSEYPFNNKGECFLISLDDKDWYFKNENSYTCKSLTSELETVIPETILNLNIEDGTFIVYDKTSVQSSNNNNIIIEIRNVVKGTRVFPPEFTISTVKLDIEDIAKRQYDIVERKFLIKHDKETKPWLMETLTEWTKRVFTTKG